ncbi:MAG: carbohydrate kinase family protein [Patescibacteria group bacterium]
MYDIITFGSATRDIVIKPRKLTSLKYNKDSSSEKEVCFPVGSKIDVEDIQFYTGGGGTNTAVTFALQRFKTAFCGMVGNDLAGGEIIEELKKPKIDTSFVFKTSKKLTNHSVVILEQNHERTILAYRGASELMEGKDIPWKKLNTKWIYIAPLTGLALSSFADLLNFSKEHGIKIAANPSIAQLSLANFSDIAKNIDILLLNQEEASFLTKIPFENDQEIFKKLDEMCPGIAVMTKGGEGAVVSDGKSIYRAKPAEDRKIVDTTGAGDAFGSGFVSEFIVSGGDIEKSMQFAMANSEGCIGQIGAKNGLLKKGEEFERVKVTKE